MAPWHGVDARDRCHDGAYLMGYHSYHMPYLSSDPPSRFLRFAPFADLSDIEAGIAQLAQQVDH